MFSGQGCGGQQTFPYRRKIKLSAQFLYFRKRNIYFFKKRAVTLSILFFKYFTTHIVRSLCLAKYFSTGFERIRAQDIDRLTLIVRAHLFIAKKGPDHLFGYDFDWKYDREKRWT
jgi:hypothetical protein